MEETEAIWEQYHRRLLSFIQKRVNGDDAEDILQNVFIKVHSGLKDLQENKNLIAWLYRITIKNKRKPLALAWG